MFYKIKELISNHPIAFGIGMAVYIGIGAGYPLYQLQKTQQIKLEDRIVYLEEKLNVQRLVSTRLASIDRRSELFKDIAFQEKWESEEVKAEVQRLLEYAEFASKKKDYSRALDFYKEANQIQETLASHYYAGRTSYLSGNLESTEKEWKLALALDSSIRYPEMRFYLGVILHEMGKIQESRELLSEYLLKTKDSSNK